MLELNRRRFTALASLTGLLPGITYAEAAWPTRPIRLIVPFGAGMSIDMLARLMSEGLTNSLGQGVVVENKPGAAGLIGTTEVARSPADGYTLLAGVTTVMSMNPHIYVKMPYQALQDFTPIVRTANFSFVLISGMSQPYSNIQEFVALAKQKPGTIDYASVGVGTAPHILMEMLSRSAGIQLAHIPYKQPFIPDLLGGQIGVGFEPTTTAIPLIRAGKVRALAIGSKARNPQLPDVPALSEFYPGYEGDNWHGLFAPRGTPDAVIQRVNRAANEVLERQEVRARLAELGLTPGGGSSADFAQYYKADYAHWGKIIRELNIKLD